MGITANAQEQLHLLGVPRLPTPSIFAGLPNHLIMDIVKIEGNRVKVEKDNMDYHIDRFQYRRDCIEHLDKIGYAQDEERALLDASPLSKRIESEQGVFHFTNGVDTDPILWCPMEYVYETHSIVFDIASK